MARREWGLGRREPTDDRHIRLYGLTPATLPGTPTPVVIGINWYTAFDDPEQDRQGLFWIGRGKQWGTVRGGHGICLKPTALVDAIGWWGHYHQGQEGACAGFAMSRAASLMNRRRYDGFTLYHEAQKVDEWPGEDYSGTSIRAVCDVSRDRGLWRAGGGRVTGPHRADGIAANRWATSVEEVAHCLNPADAGRAILDQGFVLATNNWGRDYPRSYRIPLDALERLLFREHGDATVVTDR